MVKTSHTRLISSAIIKWFSFLNENKKEVLVTLEGEKMFVETIFRETLNGEEYIYWYSVQGEDGQEVEQSEHWIDKKHIEFWNECIDETFKPVDLKTEVVMIPQKVKDSMK
ncbi:DUF6176 family protein [Niallia sp.]|uniref:DUF6176 family protein n=1 Tax=Niallia sp. TaxID=2837523 RepID=UPI00289ED2FF|nr:DUF6176 family protein [Niallia sp.]